MKFKHYRKAVERHTDTLPSHVIGHYRDIEYQAGLLSDTTDVVGQVRRLAAILRFVIRAARKLGYSLDELASVDYKELQREWGTGEFP